MFQKAEDPPTFREANGYMLQEENRVVDANLESDPYALGSVPDG